jgi:L-aspartate oxidase
MENPYLQRRYLISFESRRLPHIFTDVLVIGAGVAGLRAALAAAAGAQVIVLTKGKCNESNSYHAQGGLAAAVAGADTVEAHVRDTLATGNGLCDEEVVRHIISRAPAAIAEMRSAGVGFDTDGSDLDLGREGGHSAARVVHADGDATGKALCEVLIRQTTEAAKIKVFEDCFTIDLLVDGGQQACTGALTYHPRYGLQIIRARQTILAAGGAGMLWRETSNPPNATADALAIAFRAGAALADVEMMQFHPTTLYVAGATRSLISEAVRGEGGYLIDRHGRRFMADYHEMGELAPRDVVSRAIMREMAKSGSTHVFLDVRHLGGGAFAERFPQIAAKCRSFGIDPASDPIPVHPAAHYMVGGAKTDLDARTSLRGLLACGEASCTGLHGANRLASNSLTEALVLGKRAGEVACELMSDPSEKLTAEPIDWTAERSDRTELDLNDVRNSLRSMMWRNVGIARRGERLSETIEIVAFWGRYMLDKEFFDPHAWEIQNMLTAAYVISECALRRTETRGVHYREDFPETDPVWARHQIVRRGEHQLIVQ